MIVVVGSLNVDYVAFAARVPGPGETLSGTRFAMHPGGKGGNQAYAAARLGAPVRMVGRVGVDVAGDWLIERLSLGGVNVAGVKRDPSVGTGTALIVVGEDGENSIVVVSGANGTVQASDLDESGTLNRADVVLLQLETPIDVVSAAAAAARRAGCVVLLDPAPAQPAASLPLALADYVTPNESELLTLCGERPRAGLPLEDARTLARRLVATGCRRVVVKLGAAGALLVGAEIDRLWPAFRVPVVDTTAAGDAFNAAFAVALSEGLDEDAAGRFAGAAAARSVTAEGAQSSMPDRATVESLLRTG
jgi:ribokinase